LDWKPNLWIINNSSASRAGLTSRQPAFPRKVVPAKGMRPFGNETDRAIVSPPWSNRWRIFMSKKSETKVASDGGPEITSAGVPWSEVPEFARADVAWIDGRHGSAQSSLPPVDVVPVPEILSKLPYLHEDRPRGSKAMLDAAGARARLRDARPGAWLISPYSGWKWAKWQSGDVGWLPADIELPATLQVAARNDMH
jgi:hypothetical protein